MCAFPDWPGQVVCICGDLWCGRVKPRAAEYSIRMLLMLRKATRATIALEMIEEG
jgi:hypothetical protein